MTHGARVLAAVVAFALALVGACVGPTLIVQQYPGPVQPQERIATLRVNGSDSVQLLALDGADVAVPIAEDSRLHIEMLPAEHTIIATDRRDPDHLARRVAFVAEAGRVYRVVTTPNQAARAAGEMRVFEVDRASDGPVRDVTIERAPRPERPRESVVVDAEAAPSGFGEGGAADANDGE